MPTQILMPALSPTMSEGNLAKWLKKEGDKVKSGDLLAEIETDKATMEFEAVDEGTLGRILVPAGTQGVPVNQPIAVLLNEGEDASAIDQMKAAAPVAPAKPAEAKAPAASTPAPAPAPRPAALAAGAPSSQPHPAPAAGKANGRLFASPLARRLAKEAGIELGQVTGSGPHGRIVRSDVEKAKSSGVAARAPSPAGAPAASGPAYEDVPFTSMRKVIARRMAESKQTVPHFYLTIDCTLDKLLALRSEVNAELKDGKVSVNDFVIRAVAVAMKKVPAVNVSFIDNMARHYRDIDIAVAVATPGGLITPIVKQADKKGLAAISAEMKDLATRARDNKLKPEEFQGGGFTISNLGMFGIREFAAIINPPQAAILAVGAGEQRAVVKGGALAIATQMSCTLAVDHRILDGAIGAEFLSAFKGLIESPLLLLL